MGIAFLKSFVASENGNLSHIIKHLEHVIDLVGVEHVGIGPDFIDHATPENQSLLGDRNPMGAKESGEDMENITKIPNFTVALMQKGYYEEDISKILGGNFLRVIKRVLG